jgi:hypothetical protein
MGIENNVVSTRGKRGETGEGVRGYLSVTGSLNEGEHMRKSEVRVDG